MSSARIHCAMLNIPQSTHDLISPFTVEIWTKRFKGILRHMNIYIFDPLPKVSHLDGMITYSGSGAPEVEGCDHHVDFLSELRKAMNH
ncbi:hypothetical protein Tco_0815837 [Tanacetum coccineum]